MRCSKCNQPEPGYKPGKDVTGIICSRCVQGMIGNAPVEVPEADENRRMENMNGRTPSDISNQIQA